MSESTITAEHAAASIEAEEFSRLLSEQVKKTASWRVRVLQLEKQVLDLQAELQAQATSEMRSTEDG